MLKINKIILISICICCTIFIYNTASFSKRLNVPVPKTDISDTLEDVSKKLTVNVYIDSTVSMEGFVVPGSETNYGKIIQDIESKIITGWETAEIKFFKFGTKIIPLKYRKHLEAAKREFYQTLETKITTHIEKVIEESNTCADNNLTVIVTDLFQHDADVSLLTGKLKEKCIRGNYAIGIIGLKSQYDGTVYDVGLNAYSFLYKGERPFYMIVLGNYSNIARYFEQVSANRNTSVIFSRNIVNPLASFEDASINEIKGLQEVSKIVPDISSDNRVKQFNIRKDDNVGLTATLKYKQYLMHYHLIQKN